MNMKKFDLAPKFRVSRNLDGSQAFEVIDPNDPPLWASLLSLGCLCAGGIFVGIVCAFIVVWLAP